MFRLHKSKSVSYTHLDVYKRQLDAQSFANKLGEVSEAQIIDVRTPEEFNSKHLDNAVNIDCLLYTSRCV